MKCNICKNEIKNYDEEFHKLKIDDSHFAYICTDCVDKITMWQRQINSNFFPTKLLKKRYEK